MEYVMEKNCLECGDVLHGRTDKKFCSDACRNTYNNKKKSTAGIALVRRINGILIRNRNILATLNPGGKTSVHRVKLINSGFDFGFFTHHYTTKAGTVYYFCYDQGYLPLEHDYFMLVSRNTGG
jgi:predicted nucleic acid-binding Zn ribbon protein